MNDSHVDGIYREAPKNNNSAGIPHSLLFMILQRLQTNRLGDNPQRRTLQ